MTASDIYEKLKDKGRAVTIRVTTEANPDQTTGDPGTETTTDYTTYAVEQSMTMAQRSQYSAILGVDVAMKTRSFMLAAVDDDGSALSLDTSMKLIDTDGAEMMIVDQGPVKPGETLLYYDVVARGA